MAPPGGAIDGYFGHEYKLFQAEGSDDSRHPDTVVSSRWEGPFACVAHRRLRDAGFDAGAAVWLRSYVMKHRIIVRALVREGNAEIIWDDVAGTVTGDHYKVPSLREKLAGPMPYKTGSEAAIYELQDPGHNAADFLTLLSFATLTLEPPDVILPESLQGITPTGPAEVYTLTPEELASGRVVQ